jgi:hypothetical protein
MLPDHVCASPAPSIVFALKVLCRRMVTQEHADAGLRHTISRSHLSRCAAPSGAHAACQLSEQLDPVNSACNIANAARSLKSKSHRSKLDTRVRQSGSQSDTKPRRRWRRVIHLSLRSASGVVRCQLSEQLKTSLHWKKNMKILLVAQESRPPQGHSDHTRVTPAAAQRRHAACQSSASEA